MTNIALLHSHGTTKQKHSDIFKDIELMKKLKVEIRKLVELENSPTEPANYFGLPRIAFSKDSKLVSAQVFSSIYFPPLTTLSNDTIKTETKQTSILSIFSTDKNGKIKKTLIRTNGNARDTEIRDFSISTGEYNLADLKKLGFIQSVAAFQGKKTGNLSLLAQY